MPKEKQNPQTASVDPAILEENKHRKKMTSVLHRTVSSQDDTVEGVKQSGQGPTDYDDEYLNGDREKIVETAKNEAGNS